MSPAPPPPSGRLPEGLALGAAAVFGAVLVLAILLVGRAVTGGSETETADPPNASAVPQGSPGTRGGSGAGSGFGDLPPEAGGSEDPDGSTTTTSPDDSSPGGDGEDDSSAPGDDGEPPACPDGVDIVICEAAAFVQQARGKPFRTFPEVELLDDAEFDRALLADFDEYREELVIDDVTLTALGLLDPGVSLESVYRDSLEVGVVGFYDPETGRTVVRGSELDLYRQLVLVHELVHAFDDQWFDLDRSDFVDDEADYGFSAVVEGDASRIENLWRSQLSAGDRADLDRQEMTALSPEDLERLFDLPGVVRALQFSPYVDGANYVTELAEVGGESAVDVALAVPPSTSEEILHPGLVRQADPEIVVPAPPADGTVVGEGRVGELLTRLWLGPAPAEGWGGDRYVTWQADGAACIRVDSLGDDDDQTVELRDAATAWAGLAPSTRSVEATTVEGRTAVRITACH